MDKKEFENTEKNKEWVKHQQIGFGGLKHLEKIAQGLLLLIESEKKITEEKIKQAKEMLEKMRVK